MPLPREVLVLWLIVGTALAAPLHVHDGDRISEALAAGSIDAHQALWLTYLQHFEPDALPPAYAPGSQVAGLCGTGVVMALKERWSEFTPAERERMTAVLAPWKQDLLDPMIPVSHAGAAAETCWGQQGAGRINSGSFSVEWQSSSGSAYASRFGDALEYGRDALLDLGWQDADGMDDYLMMAYIADGSYAGAYTSVERCGSYYMPYIVAYSGSFASSSWYKSMASHEYNHAMQFSYGFGHEFWFWEATATYTEEDVYSASDWWSSYVDVYFAYPYVAMNAYSNDSNDVEFWHMYGMGVWGFYLDEHVGGHDLLIDMWEYSADYGYYYDVYMEDTLTHLGYDFEEVYDGFVAANAARDYADRHRMDEVAVTDAVYELPASGGNSGSTRPRYLGQNYLTVDPALATEELPDLLVTFEGEDAGNWTVLLIGVNGGGEVADVVKMEISEDAGEATLTDFGAYEEVWIGVSPRRERTSGFSYTWSMDAVPAPEPPKEDFEDDEEAVAGGGCGCATGAPAAGWLLALPLLGLRRRR